MKNVSEFRVLYDRDSDVLYISTRQTPAARGVEDRLGIVWRYDSAGELIGATVVDYYDHWSSKRSELSREIARKFDIPQKVAETVLDHAKDF
jgi:uncharacterized protein YuzE